MAYRGVHTKDAAYIKRRDGKSYYYRVLKKGVLNSVNEINILN